jgi:hypothetical protein
MPVQQLIPPTIAEVEQSIASFERQYGITTPDFLASTNSTFIDDDDAVEWLYCVEQLKVLREGCTLA